MYVWATIFALKGRFLFMNNYKENITKKIEEIVSRAGFQLIELIFRGSQQKPVIEIFIDSKNGVSANDCATISKEISSILDSSELNVKDYRLDVSSPGVDKPLKYLWQYDKNIGRLFELVYQEGNEKKSLKCKLLSIDENILVFEVNKSTIEINFNQIISAKVLISF